MTDILQLKKRECRHSRVPPGNSLVTHGQHKGRAGLCANAGLLAAAGRAAADSRRFKRYFY